MDSKEFVNKDSFKLILLQSLKSQMRTKFGDAITNNIQKYLSNDINTTPESIINGVSNSISESEGFSELLTTFLQDVDTLFSDSDKQNTTSLPTNVNPDETKTYDSLYSSVSSLNTSSIDFLSSDQFQGLTQKLTNGSSVEKLESLETFCRLPTLEHLVKPTLWPAVESGLHSVISCDICFLRESGLRLYTKMLTSPEPKVVQESFSSLVKYLLQSLLPSMNECNLNAEFSRKCQVAVEVTAILNKFLQNISTHWLRYPQAVIEDITIYSVSIVSLASKISNGFPIWMCIALCDPEARWLKNIMNGYIGRSFLIAALEKDIIILKFLVEFCERFLSNDDNMLIEKANCCKNSAYVSEMTHIICFLSHLLQYSDGRNILNVVISNSTFSGWVSVLDVIMQCTWKLSKVVCFKCSRTVFTTVSNKWRCFWFSDVTTIQDSMIKILVSPINDLDCFSHFPNGVCFAMQCLAETFSNFSAISCISKLIINGNYLICILLQHCIQQINYSDASEITALNVNLLLTSLELVKKLFFFPNILIMKSEFIKVLAEWWLKINHISFPKIKSLMNNQKVIEEIGIHLTRIELKIIDVHICLLSKPLGISICHNTSLFETSLNVLLEKMLKSMKSKNSVCPADVSVLSTALNCDITLRQILNKSYIFKLSSVIWHIKENCDYNENLEAIKSILDVIVPFIFSDLVRTDMFVDTNPSTGIKLLEYALLFPNITKCEYFTSEDSAILGLQIISMLTNSVQSSCILQTKFKLTEILFESQCNLIVFGENSVIDQVCLLQNHILVKLYAIGGPSERLLPPETLLSVNEIYEWPIVTSYPVPDVYYKILKSRDDEISEINFEAKLVSMNLQNLFMEYVGCHTELTSSLIPLFLKNGMENITESSHISKTLNLITLDDSIDVLLCEEICNGILMSIRYGIVLCLLPEDSNHKLEKLVKAGKYLLGLKNRTQFDIFLSTIFLMFKGDSTTAWQFLETFAKSKNSLCVWSERLMQPMENDSNIFTTCHSVIMEYCDLIVKETLPTIFSAFQFSGVLPSIMFTYWTNQCYWNYLDWNQICQFVLLSVLFSGDYAIYFYVSVLKHLKGIILTHAHSHDIICVLKKNAVTNYSMADHIEFIIDLSNRYHSYLSRAVDDILTNEPLCGTHEDVSIE